jgi:hypothetical protein
VFLGRLREAGVDLVPLRELAGRISADAPLIALRLAMLEHARGVRASYFLLHTAGYYADRDRVLESAGRLQRLGHEVGWHNDLVTLDLVDGIDPVAYLHDELAWLRSHGIAITGVSAHGSLHCHRLGYTNDEFFLDHPTPSGLRLRHARLADFGLDYDASRLDVDSYWSDATFDQSRRRWHPDNLDLELLGPGDRGVVLVHPCHWDSSPASKVVRLVRRLSARQSR